MRALPCLLALSLIAGLDSTAGEIDRAFVEKVLLKRDFEAARSLTSADIVFIDPTTASMELDHAHGIRGQDNVITQLRDYQLKNSKFDIEHEFTAGPYACFIGAFSANFYGESELTEFPFMMVLRVDDQLITLRLDYGDYDSFLPAARQIDGITEDLEHPVVVSAKAYIEAYGRRDYEAMAEMRSDKVVFHDQTAVAIGLGTAVKGNEAVDQAFRRNLGRRKQFLIETDYQFFHGDFAVFAGNSSYSLDGKSVGLQSESFDVTQQIAIVLKFEDGKIIQHNDFVDYDGYTRALETAKKGQRTERLSD